MATVQARVTTTQLWVRSLRAPFLVASLIPMVLAALLAWDDQGYVDASLLGLTTLGLACIHLATNMLNDNFDYRSGADLAVKHHNPFAGGSRVLLQGVLGIRSHLGVSLAFLAVGAAVGLYLVALRGPILLPIGLAGFIFGVFYVVPPLRFAHRGVGEVLVALAFGPSVVMGTYYVQTGSLRADAAVLSIPLGLLVMAILWVNEFPDVEADGAAGKRTLVLRLGSKPSAQVYSLTLFSAYAATALGVLGGLLPWGMLAVLLSAPLALRAARVVRRTHADPHAIIPANATTILLLLAFGALGIIGLLVAGLVGPASH